MVKKRSFVDEREDVQKKAFTKWINTRLTKVNHPPVDDLYQDLRDGVVLLKLLECLTGNEYKREIGRMRVHHIGNVNKAIAVLNEHGIKLLSISSNDIVDGNPKLTLALIWSIIQFWQVKDVFKTVAPDVQQNNIEKFLLNWCQQTTKGYKGVEIKDFTRSWQDGLGFNALIHHFRPDLFDYDEILQNASERNLEHAFSVAKNVFKIERYLDVEDVLSEYPDKKSIMMYIMCYFQQLPLSSIIIQDKNNGTSTETESIRSYKETTISSSISPELTSYQINMEKILSWILQLEDKLDNKEKVVLNDLKLVKEQFQAHEDFMVSLTKEQNQIGQVLQEGNHLFNNGQLQLREENEIKEQMRILNKRWESLRKKALDRQSTLHKTLMKLQIDQIESFDKWLANAEHRIQNDLNIMDEDLSGIERQYKQLALLQDDLVSQQQITESLQNMVIVIDDTSSTNGTGDQIKFNSNDIEQKLSNLSERWASICNFVQNRWITLQEVKIELEQIYTAQDKLDKWLTKKEFELKQIKLETNVLDTDVLMKQVNIIQKTELEMEDMKQLILLFDNSTKVLTNHYDSTSPLMKRLNEKLNNYEQQWTILIKDLDYVTKRLKSSNINYETSTSTSVKPSFDVGSNSPIAGDILKKTITTTIEETTTTYSNGINGINSSSPKKRKIDTIMKKDFDSSTKRYHDWIDNIENIIDMKHLENVSPDERQEIIQEVKMKFESYDEQFKHLVQNGIEITHQLREANEDAGEHEKSLRDLEQHWYKLRTLILSNEKDIEINIYTKKFNDELKILEKARDEYQYWLDTTKIETNGNDNSQIISAQNEINKVKLKSIQSHDERLNNLRYMAEHLQQLNAGDTTSIQRANELIRAWDDTHSKIRERNIHIERTYDQRDMDRPKPRDDNSAAININIQPQQSTMTTQTTKLSPTGFTGTGVNTSFSSTSSSTTHHQHYPSSTYDVHHRREVDNSLITSPNRTDNHSQQSTLGQSIGENGSVFTLTNIYTFADNSNNSSSLNDINNRGGDGLYSRTFDQTHRNMGPNSDKYTIKSIVEVFDKPEQETEIDKLIRETHTSSEHRLTRKTRTSGSDTTDFGGSSRYYHGQSTSITPTSQSKYSENRLVDLSETQLPHSFIEQQKKIREWLEHVEQPLLTDKIQKCDIQSIEQKKKIYKDLLDQTFEQERTMEYLNSVANEYFGKLTHDISRGLQIELENFQDRLYDVKMFLSERLTKYNRLHKTLSDFERGVEDVKNWIRTAQPRLAMEDATTMGDSRLLENQLNRSQILQHEIREMQTTLNKLNKDVVELTQDADESFARRLRDEMKDLNVSWSHIISSTKIQSQNIQDALKRNKEIHESIQEMEDWIIDKDREAPADDGPIFYQDQIRERVEQYQKIQTELSFRENEVRRLIEQGRISSSTMTSGIPDLAQSLENLVSDWTNLQKKVDSKVQYYSEIYTLHEELKSLLNQETTWLDTLQDKILTSVNGGADAEEISEELDTLERFVKIHKKTNYEKILEIYDRLQATKVSIPATGSQLNQFKIRWAQLHEDAYKKIHSLNQAITDYQHMGHQITAMREWLRHTDGTINSRLKDDVFADDVPGEAEKLIQEFNQYEALLRSIEDKVHALRSSGKGEAARRLDQQLEFLRSQFLNLQTKFRHFQKPSDFEPKYANMRQILQDVEQNMHVLDIRTDDPDVIHSQLEHCIKLYKTLSDIKSEVEYVIRTGRSIVEKRQIDEPNELTRQIDRLKQSYNDLGARVSTSKVQLDNVERHIRKFRKEYAHINDWLIKADNEIKKIENKQVSKNTKEEIDWIRATRNDIKKLETTFETLKSLERTIIKDANRQLPILNEKVMDLKRQVDLLDRRLKDRYDVVEGQVRKLEDDYQRFIQIYQEIIIRLEKLESLLSDAERVLDLTRISQVQDELRNVRPQLDELLALGQELVSKSEKYSKLVGPDIENITRRFEDLQRRIRQIQDQQEKRSKERIEKEEYGNRQQEDNTTTSGWERQEKDSTTRHEYYQEKIHNRHERESRHRSPSESSDISAAAGVIDEEFKKKYLRCLAYMKLIERLYDAGEDSDDSDLHTTKTTRRERTIHDRPEYEEIEKIIRETEERAYVIEKTDVDQARRIRDKIRRLREHLENLKQRPYQTRTNDEIVRYNTRVEERIRTQERTIPRERGEFDSDFIYDVDDTRSVISEPAPHYNTKYRKTVHSLERCKLDQQQQYYYPQESDYYLQPLLRVRSLKAIDRALSAPSSPILQPKYRSYERSNVQFTKDMSNKRSANVDNYQSHISKSQSLPSSPYGFPLQPYSPQFIPIRQQPLLYRERVIDRHIAERSHSQGESSRQAHDSTSTRQAQQQQQHAGSTSHTTARSTSANANLSNRSIPVQYENIAHGKSAGASAAGSAGVGRETYHTYQNRYSGQGGAAMNGQDGYSYRDYNYGQPIPTYYNDRTAERTYQDQGNQYQYQAGGGSNSYRQQYNEGAGGGGQQYFQHYPQQPYQDYPPPNHRPTNDYYFDQQPAHHRSNHPSYHHPTRVVN